MALHHSPLIIYYASASADTSSLTATSWDTNKVSWHFASEFQLSVINTGAPSNKYGASALPSASLAGITLALCPSNWAERVSILWIVPAKGTSLLIMLT